MVNPTPSCKHARILTKVCLKGKKRCRAQSCKEFKSKNETWLKVE